jgi:hypothetical protein
VTDAIQIASGQFVACALDQSGQVVCWGTWYLINGNTRSSGVNLPDIPALPPAPPTALRQSDAIVEIAASDNLCVRMRDGSVECSGRGALGDGNWHLVNDGPVSVRGVHDAIRLVGGASQSCVIRRGNATVCWGNPGVGNVDATSLQPTAPWVAGQATSVGIGDGHSCLLLESGQVVCWGLGQDGMTGSSRGGVPVIGLETARSIAIGWFGGCAQRTDNAVACWGDNRFGALDVADTIVGVTDAGR